MASQTENELTINAPHDPQRSRSAKWIPLVVIGVLLLAGAFWKMRSGGGQGGGGREGRGDRAEPPPTVRVVSANVGNVASTLLVTGTLRSNQDVNLSSKIS